MNVSVFFDKKILLLMSDNRKDHELSIPIEKQRTKYVMPGLGFVT